MGILTVIWSLGAGASLVMGGIYTVIWLQKGRTQRSWAHLWISIAAFSATATALFEIILLNAKSIETWQWGVRFVFFPTGMVIIALAWYLYVYLITTRRWLAWTITGIWSFALLINCWPSYGILYYKITAIRQVSLPWGETFSAVKGIVNPLKFVIDVASLLFVIYVIDAGIQLYRQGKGHQTLMVCGSTLFFILLAGIHTPLVDSAIIASPTIISLSFLCIVCVLGLQLAGNDAKLDTLTRSVENSDERWDALLENVELAVISFDGKGRLTYVNPFYEKLTGFTKKTVLGKSIKKYLAPSEVPEIEARFKLMVTEGPRPQSEWTLRCADNRERRLGNCQAK